MKIRKTQLSRTKSFVFAFLLVLVVAGVILKVVQASLDTNSPLKRYLDTNVIADFVCSGILALLAAAFSLRKGIVLPRLVFGDGRRIFNGNDLQQQFNADATLSPTLDNGWRAEGSGAHRESVVTYKGPVNQLFSIAVQFKPVRTTPAHNKWKAGFIFRRSDNSEAIVVHLDNHNLLLGYLDRQISVRTPISKTLEGCWSLLEVQMSVGEPAITQKVFCHVDGQSYFLGTIPADKFPWSVTISMWSDEQKHHVVLIRDISVSNALA